MRRPFDVRDTAEPWIERQPVTIVSADAHATVVVIIDEGAAQRSVGDG